MHQIVQVSSKNSVFEHMWCFVLYFWSSDFAEFGPVGFYSGTWWIVPNEGVEFLHALGCHKMLNFSAWTSNFFCCCSTLAQYGFQMWTHISHFFCLTIHLSSEDQGSWNPWGHGYLGK